MSTYSDSTTTPANFGLADFLNTQPPNFCPADTYCTYGHFDFKVLSSNNRLPFKYTTVVISADALQFVDQFEHVHHKTLDLSTRHKAVNFINNMASAQERWSQRGQAQSRLCVWRSSRVSSRTEL